MERSTLNFTEWFVVSFFLAMMVSIVLISKLSSANAKVLLAKHIPTEIIQVEVEGEVQKPGVYEIEVGSTYGELLKKTRPKRFADLTAIRLDDSVQTTNLQIFPLKEIRVRVGGEVENPEVYILKPGARVCELKSKVVALESADLSLFSSRRMLKDGEEILVPKRK